MRSLAILGTRGIPAQHGGFETFAERLALYLVDHGWAVTVYCQTDGGNAPQHDVWRGVHRVVVPTRHAGALGTMAFDWRCIRDVSVARPDVVLTLGYNTALFDWWLRYRGLTNLINMDGVEWRRQKWSWPARLWLLLNERAACRIGDHLIADHPRIAAHLSQIAPSHKITMIPYGADIVDGQSATAALTLRKFGTELRGYALVVARIEPENSILEIVTAFSYRARRCQLVVLGRLDPHGNRYHAAVHAAASREVVFPGAVYDHDVVACLRQNARLYVHGHSVGGTNPSLVEAMGAGCAVLAHDNEFNRWVAGENAAFFRDTGTCTDALDKLLDNEQTLTDMRLWSRQRHAALFTWPVVLKAYEDLLTAYATRK